MNLGKISLGLMVIFTGVFILLGNLGILTFNWSAVVYFWPVFIILAGINLLLPKKMEGQILSVMATVIVLLFFAYQGLKHVDNAWIRSEKKEIVLDNEELSLLSQEYNADIAYAELEISGGAVEYTLGGVSPKLIDIEAYSAGSRFSLSSKLLGDKVELDFTQKGSGKITQKGFKAENKAKIRLNKNPIWDIKLEIGAGAANFDLTSFKVRKLKIEGGVSSVKVKMGVPVDGLSTIDFEGGISSLDIEVPAQVGCIIYAESALSSLSFPGFTKQTDGSYQSDNYTGASKRIEVKLENGLSSIKVNRY